MPVNTALANEIWARYVYLRDNGHLDFVQKYTRCEDFFVGLQWDAKDLALLKAVKRPALTINKIMSTIANVLGEQIYNRTDITFKPRNEGATAAVADVLTKVFMQISDNNQLAWIRSDVFCDGVIGSRGFFDARLDFSDSLRGEVRVTHPNPKNVLIDCDGDEYDPDTWGDVIVTKWMSVDQIEILYSKADAKLLRDRGMNVNTLYGADSIESDRDRFGTPQNRESPYGPGEGDGNLRNIRVIERQWKKLGIVQHLVELTTGDVRQVPTDWDEARLDAHLKANPNLAVTKKRIQRIRWTVIADNIVLHDDWSPYKHFTIVPFFPYFRRGKTVGLVENLLGPQELLNKVSSQELHVVNTTANSGWKIKQNSVKNMSIAELEQRGAQTGLVLVVDEMDGAEKISPNATPTGLDRISYKAEDHIKSISGVSDYMQGFAREDVSAKSVNSNKQSGQANLAKVMDNLNRTDFLLARNILDMVQTFYTEARLIYITTDRLTNVTEEVGLNQPSPEGVIVNDLTIGEYAVVVTNQPERDTFEETQFDQALRLRTEANVGIPDKFILQSSRLKNKADIIKAMEGDSTTPEAQAAAALKARNGEATVAGLEADVVVKQSDAQLKQAKSQKEIATLHEETAGGEMAFEERKLQMEMDLKWEQMKQEFALKREQMDQEMALKKEQATADSMTKRIAAVEQAKNKPKPQAGAAP
jgi:hypothetical protein